MDNKIFDTHSHLDDGKYDEDREILIGKLQENGVGLVCDIGADLCSSKAAIDLAKRYDFIYAAVGFHPYDAQDMTASELDEIRKLAGEEKAVAIGEIGLDYHFENCVKEKQKYWFAQQMEVAQDLDMPVIIHCREAFGDTLEIMKKYPKVGGIMHCFSGGSELAKQVLKLGYYISFAGPVTYKNARNLLEAVEVVPMDKLLVETDCPYLSPDGHRGERNEPKNAEITCRKLAQIKGVTFEEMAKATYTNGKRVYRI